MELTSQLSNDGAFVDDHQGDGRSDDNAQVTGNNVGGNSFPFDSEGAQVFRDAIPDSVDIDTSTAGLSAGTSDSSTPRPLKPCLSWWSLIEHMVDVSREDLLAMSC
ncbi:hypothetical protein DVH05_005748 [Phytophthora capsici]|nr:hypothetical protein DVH05_005748 [Phytophthora capsici]